MEENGAKHRPNTAGLRPPWKPGQSGNPNGRPCGPSLTTRLRDLLEGDRVRGKRLKDGKQAVDRLAEAILDGAIDGDPRLIQQLWDRLEGKVPLRIAGADGEDLSVKHYHVSNAPDDL
jgi:hypothetical protein